MAKGKKQDILALISADHRKVEGIFSQIESAKKPDDVYKLFNEIYQELNLHARAEELVFYPSLREFEDTDDLIEEAESEHEEVEVMLEEIKALSPNAEDFMDRIAELKEAVQHHVQEEENEVFEVIRESFDNQELQALGLEFQEAKTKLAAEIAESAAR